MKANDKYHIRYIEGCSPQTKSFKTKAALEKFIAGFIKKHGGLDDRGDNWVEFIFRGEILKLEHKLQE